jgi:hypothetical protein
MLTYALHTENILAYATQNIQLLYTGRTNIDINPILIILVIAVVVGIYVKKSKGKAETPKRYEQQYSSHYGKQSQSIGEAVAKKYCTSCGNSMNTHAKFCVKCGESIEENLIEKQ